MESDTVSSVDLSSGLPSPKQFAELFMAELRKRGETRDMEFDEPQFRIIRGDNGITNLKNFYEENTRLPATDRKQHLETIVTGLVASEMDLPTEFADARPDIKIKLWCRATMEHMKWESKLNGGEPLVMPLVPVGEHLYASVVYDMPLSVRSLSMKELDDWGVSVYEALEVARENLSEDEFSYAQIGTNLYASMSGDTYDASRILLPEKIRQLEVCGAPVAMVPNRDSLFVTGSEDDEGLAMMVELAEQTLDEPRPMIATPLKLEGDEWTDWMPPDSHPLFNRFKLLEAQYYGTEYAEQKEMLEAYHDKNQLELFVASFMAAQDDSGDVVTYCVWSKEVDSLLPQTEKITFFRSEDDDDPVAALAGWDKVQHILGDMLEPIDDLYPPRFRVRSFPSDEQLEAIGKEPL